MGRLPTRETEMAGSLFSFFFQRRKIIVSVHAHGRALAFQVSLRTELTKLPLTAR